ncbi:hypothetical protein CICLE_v10013641mg [Citrus x clementina]|uniref:Uncharacterized protein n=1 Tax=Citrus clementina TaxID=85681 RepID=V4SW77_CITCL|nr:hypothetical protein CICLE_v10013641mg [Citrus x clementina]
MDIERRVSPSQQVVASIPVAARRLSCRHLSLEPVVSFMPIIVKCKCNVQSEKNRTKSNRAETEIDSRTQPDRMLPALGLSYKKANRRLQPPSFIYRRLSLRDAATRVQCATLQQPRSSSRATYWQPLEPTAVANPCGGAAAANPGDHDPNQCPGDPNQQAITNSG